MTSERSDLSREAVQAITRSTGSPLPAERLDAVTATINAIRGALAPLRAIDFGDIAPASVYTTHLIAEQHDAAL
jgi:hypothetical protein